MLNKEYFTTSMTNSDLFDRKAYKTAALSQLKGNWTVACVVTLIVLIASVMLNIGSIIDSIKASTLDYGHSGSNFYFNLNSNKPVFTATDYIGMASSLLSIILSGIIAITLTKSFLDMSNGKKLTYEDFIKNLDLWAKGILEKLWSTLFIILWSLLFYIPGIIKSIAYSQAFYILAAYPEVTVTQALKISMKITKGYKSDLFVMDLSFIGWILLSFATAGIGFIWLIPYMQTTKANAFKFLMENAIARNRVTYEELHGGKSFNETTEEQAENFETQTENSNSEENEIPKVILCEDLTNKSEENS